MRNLVLKIFLLWDFLVLFSFFTFKTSLLVLQFLLSLAYSILILLLETSLAEGSSLKWHPQVTEFETFVFQEAKVPHSLQDSALIHPWSQPFQALPHVQRLFSFSSSRYCLFPLLSPSQIPRHILGCGGFMLLHSFIVIAALGLQVGSVAVFLVIQTDSWTLLPAPTICLELQFLSSFKSEQWWGTLNILKLFFYSLWNLTTKMELGKKMSWNHEELPTYQHW